MVPCTSRPITSSQGCRGRTRAELAARQALHRQPWDQHSACAHAAHLEGCACAGGTDPLAPSNPAARGACGSTPAAPPQRVGPVGRGAPTAAASTPAASRSGGRTTGAWRHAPRRAHQPWPPAPVQIGHWDWARWPGSPTLPGTRRRLFHSWPARPVPGLGRRGCAAHVCRTCCAPCATAPRARSPALLWR